MFAQQQLQTTTHSGSNSVRQDNCLRIGKHISSFTVWTWWLGGVVSDRSTRKVSRFGTKLFNLLAVTWRLDPRSFVVMTWTDMASLKLEGCGHFSNLQVCRILEVPQYFQNLKSLKEYWSQMLNFFHDPFWGYGAWFGMMYLVLLPPAKWVCFKLCSSHEQVPVHQLV